MGSDGFSRLLLFLHVAGTVKSSWVCGQDPCDPCSGGVSSAVLEETLVLSGHVLSADRSSCLGQIKVQQAVPEQQVGSSWAGTGMLRRAVLELTSHWPFLLMTGLEERGASHLRNVGFGVTLQNPGWCLFGRAGSQLSSVGGMLAGFGSRKLGKLPGGAGRAAAPALLVFAVLGTAPDTPGCSEPFPQLLGSLLNRVLCPRSVASPLSFQPS